MSTDLLSLEHLSVLLFSFVWEKTERIKRNNIIGRIEEGDIGLVDIETKLKALKAAWVTSILIIMVCYVDNTTSMYKELCWY